MKTIPQEDIIARVIDPAVLDDPELIRKRKEARRNMTDEERQAMLSRAVERTAQEHYERFKRETLELARQEREAKERKAKEADKVATPSDRP